MLWWTLRKMQSGDRIARRAAAQALAAESDERAMTALVEALQDEDQQVQRTAIEAICRRGGAFAVDALLRALYKAKDRSLPALISGLASLGEASEAALLKLYKENINGVYRPIALEAMLQSGHAGFADALVAALNDLSNYDPARRIEIQGRIKNHIKKLGQAGFDALSRAMAGTDRRARSTAIEVFGDNAESRALQPLIREVKDNRDVGLALVALAKIGTPDAVDFVMKTAKEPDPELRRTALWAIGKARLTCATELLLRTLSEHCSARGTQEAAIVSAAAWSSGEMGLKEAVPSLIEMLERGDDTARTALRVIADPRAVMPMMRDLMKSETESRLSDFVGLLSRCVTDVSVDDLRTIAQLPDFTTEKQDYDNYGQWTKVEISCAKARQASITELKRRGVRG